MTRIVKLAVPLIALAFLGSAVVEPARAQFGGEQIQQFAPLMGTMKAKLGKKRFGQAMSMMGPIMSQVATDGSFNFGGDAMSQFAPLMEIMKERMGRARFARLVQIVGPMMGNMMDGGGGGFGNIDPENFDINNMSGMIDAENISGIQQMITGVGGHRRAARHRKPAAAAPTPE